MQESLKFKKNIEYSLTPHTEEELLIYKEPIAITKINSILTELHITTQNLHNDREYKKKEIENILKQIKADKNFIIEFEQEKNLYVESICEQSFKEICIYYLI
jgi:hypothetical protein